MWVLWHWVKCVLSSVARNIVTTYNLRTWWFRIIYRLILLSFDIQIWVISDGIRCLFTWSKFVNYLVSNRQNISETYFISFILFHTMSCIHNILCPTICLNGSIRNLTHTNVESLFFDLLTESIIFLIYRKGWIYNQNFFCDIVLPSLIPSSISHSRHNTFQRY
jgi:hypothetical protein